MVCFRSLIVGWLITLIGLSHTATAQVKTEKVAPRLAEVGRHMFFDTSLSRDGKVSCASCHRPDQRFSDGFPTSVGVDGRRGTRNTPSLLDVGSQPQMFWDGRRDSLHSQALDPLLNPVEHGFSDRAGLLAALRGKREFIEAALRNQQNPRQTRELALRQSGDSTRLRLTDESLLTYLASALTAYQQTLKSPDSAFDRFIAGDARALSVSATRGLAIFRGPARCAQCHAIDADHISGRPTLTDHGFYRSLSRNMPDQEAMAEAVKRISLLKPTELERSVLVASDFAIAQLGRYVVTGNLQDIGKFRTPSLRGVALTAPYMHDGSITTLREAARVELYDHGIEDPGSFGRPIALAPHEFEDLMSFLESLH